MPITFHGQGSQFPHFRRLEAYFLGLSERSNLSLRFNCTDHPGFGISNRPFPLVMNDYGPVPVKFHGQRTPFAHYGAPDARFLDLKLTF